MKLVGAARATTHCTLALSRWTGSAGEDFASILRALGYRMRPAIDTAPNVVNPKASRARRGLAISWVTKTLVTAALIGICLHAARYAGQQGIANLITIVPPVMAQQAPLPKDDDATQLKQAVDSATAELRQSLQQEHDRAEALERELVKAWRYVGKLLSMRDGEADQFSRAVDSATASLRQSLEQEQDRAEALATELAKLQGAVERTSAAVEGQTDVSLPAWASSYAFMLLSFSSSLASTSLPLMSFPVSCARFNRLV